MKNFQESIFQDCLYFKGDRPCVPHKLYGVSCAGCSFYKQATRLLVIKLGAPGDVLRTTTLLKPLERERGPLRVFWITKPDSFFLFKHNPFIEQVWTPEESALYLQSFTFDLAINPDADFLSAALLKAARAKEKRGISLDEHGFLFPLSYAAEKWMKLGLNDEEKRKNRETYQSILLKMAELSPQSVSRPLFFFSPEEMAQRAEWEKRLKLTSRKRIGLFTGAGARWAYKKWTEAGFCELISLLLRKEWEVLLLGGEEEKERNRRLQEKFPDVVYTGEHPVREFAVILSLCDLLVTADTLPLHLALALHIPVVAYFGPTSPHEIELYGSGSKVVPDLDCLSCYLPSCYRQPYCMELISAESIYREILRWLS